MLVETGFAATAPARAAANSPRAARDVHACSQQAAAGAALCESLDTALRASASSAASGCLKPFSPAAAPPPPPPPPSVPFSPTASAPLKSPPLMSSPAFAAALQSVVLNKTPKPSTAPSNRSIASPGMPKGDDLMAALVARISARRRRMTYTEAKDRTAPEASGAGARQSTSDWSDAASASGYQRSTLQYHKPL